jgi:hypothetical protein
MTSQISELLHRFLDLYEREPDALYRALEAPAFAFACDVPLEEQLSLLEVGTSQTKAEILRKTLIETSGLGSRHGLLRAEIEASISPEGVAAKRNRETLARFFEKQREREALLAERGLTCDEVGAQRARDLLSSKKISAELLRFFASLLPESTRSRTRSRNWMIPTFQSSYRIV